MQFYARLYRNLIAWERRRFRQSSTLVTTWKVVRWPYIVLGYAGLFTCSIPIFYGLPFGVLIASHSSHNEPTSMWWVLSSIVIIVTLALRTYTTLAGPQIFASM